MPGFGEGGGFEGCLEGLVGEFGGCGGDLEGGFEEEELQGGIAAVGKEMAFAF